MQRNGDLDKTNKCALVKDEILRGMQDIKNYNHCNQSQKSN